MTQPHHGKRLRETLGATNLCNFEADKYCDNIDKSSEVTMGSIPIIPAAQFQGAVQADPGHLADAVHSAATQAAGGDASQSKNYANQMHSAIGVLSGSAAPLVAKGAAGGAIMHTAQDAVASRLQTMVAKQAAAAGQVNTAQPQRVVQIDDVETVLPSVLAVQFSDLDLIGWLKMAPELLFKPPKATWIAPPPAPQTIADDACIALFADWGTGLYGAPDIRKSIASLPRCDVALHLGDTYYSGEADEIATRLVGNWPKRAGATLNRALNGNHEMYSGGKAYFQALSDFFIQPSSCFALQNSNWIIICLDTAFIDFDLDPAQVKWVMDTVKAAGKRKVILCSHHQPFSQLDNQGPKIQSALSDLLDSGRVYAWYWGHEHRLVLYDQHPRWGFKGRCIGNAGFPGFRDALPGGGKDFIQWINLAARDPDDTAAIPKARLLDGPNYWVPEDKDSYGTHSYVVLTFDGNKATETYRMPNSVAMDFEPL